MENLLRMAARINSYIAAGIIVLTALTLLAYGDEGIHIRVASIFSVFIAVMLIVTAVLAKKSLDVDVKDDDKFLSHRLMRIGTVLSVCLLAVSVVGLALGISTGTISYIYILIIPAMIFYCYCMWGLRAPKAEKTIKF